MISVVIVNWNTGDLLRNCAASVLREAEHQASRSVEVIVVDNASSDSSVRQLEEAFGEHVILVRNPQNEGFARACNIGVVRSSGDYILFLNPDTELLERSLSQLVDALDEHQEAGIVGPRLIGPDGENQESCAPFPTLLRELWRLLHLDQFRPYSSYPVGSWSLSDSRQVETVGGACMLVRRRLLDEIGPFDEGFFVYSEEVDFCRRTQDADWRIYWVPQAEVRHLGGQSTRQVARKMFLELYRNKLRYFRKHYGVGVTMIYKLVILLAALLRLVFPFFLSIWLPKRRKELLTIMFNYGALLRRLPTL